MKICPEPNPDVIKAQYSMDNSDAVSDDGNRQDHNEDVTNHKSPERVQDCNMAQNGRSSSMDPRFNKPPINRAANAYSVVQRQRMFN